MKEELVNLLKFHRKPNLKKDDLEIDDSDDRLTTLEITIFDLTATVGELVEQLHLINPALGFVSAKRDREMFLHNSILVLGEGSSSSSKKIEVEEKDTMNLTEEVSSDEALLLSCDDVNESWIVDSGASFHATANVVNYSDIIRMTNSFKDKLGQGGFGGVFKGKLLNGWLVAVKVMRESKGDSEDFMNEVASISRLRIRGLEYLHRGCNTRVVHFDILPHNILLNKNFRPKISDFGLAKLCSTQESYVSMLDARGTAEYIAPEVFSRNFGVVSYKSDVYSFGMMVLEIVGGRKNINGLADRTSEIFFPLDPYSYRTEGGSGDSWNSI
ncbi:hypothetical protein GIB67_002960 [Kingdonia uniflora]|uniref:Protein kinase domain-containing protein n=1 Tax=Kingdonia uniflora TaxID=39325 RepID=A0A7J7M8P2_9MAGN|nr:hypothetical protein GIB67_002960 [Kingdonia uniflora]